MMTSLIALAASQAGVQPPPIYIPPAPRPPLYRPPAVMPPPPPLPPPPPPPPPRGDLPTRARLIAGSISDADYPPAAIRAEAQGTTRVSLSIGVNGRVTGCAVTGSSGDATLDSTTCSLITRRFRYQPATRAGAPVTSTVSLQVRWQLPEEPKVRFAQGRFAWTVTASPAGTTACEITLTGPAFEEFDEGNCREPAAAWLVDRESMEPGHPPVQVTHVLSLLPQGEALTLPRLPGAPYWEEVAEIEVAPDGSVTACTLVSQRGTPPPYAAPAFQPLCADLTASRRFTVSEPGAVRRGRMQSALYVEVREPRRR